MVLAEQAEEEDVDDGSGGGRGEEGKAAAAADGDSGGGSGDASGRDGAADRVAAMALLVLFIAFSAALLPPTPDSTSDPADDAGSSKGLGAAERLALRRSGGGHGGKAVVGAGRLLANAVDEKVAVFDPWRRRPRAGPAAGGSRSPRAPRSRRAPGPG